MIHKNNKSLNDLFRSAEAEADGNVLSQSEVERLLQSAKRSVPVTQSTQQKLFERLLSTPLKIGMTAMTTAACITLGLIAFWPAPQQSTSNITKAPILSHGTYGSQTTDGGTQNFAMTPSGKSSFAISQSNEALPAAAIIPATPTADSLQPVELTPEQLAQLGIVLEDNGDIDFYTKPNATTEVNKFGLPPTWGVKLYLGQKISDADIAGLTIQKSSPRLVTEPDGAKRLFSFESDTAYIQKNGEQIMYMRMQNQTKIVPKQSNAVLGTTHSPRSDSKLVNSGINSNVSVIVSDSNITPDVLNEMASVNMDSIMATINIDSIVESVNVDSIVQSVHPGLQGKNTDSTLQAARVAMKSVKKIISSMRIHLDSGRVGSKPGIQIEVNTTDEIPKIQVDSGKKWDVQAPGTPSVPAATDIEQMATSLDLSKLIPIRVINNKNVEHPNELIFWYEPSPELTAAMPAAVNPVPAPQSKQLAISVYPNPTMGPATIHYELTDAPRAYFSVRNLLGQEVLNGGMTSSTTGDANLDLSKLPAGVYLLITTTDNGERDVERVVVTK